MVRRFLVKNLIRFSLIALVGSVTALPVYAYFSLQSVVLEDTVSDQNSLNDVYIYLPVVLYKNNLGMLLSTRRINAPFFDVEFIDDEQFSQMAIAWFGEVNSTTNYTDIRVGYNNEDLFVRLITFDRLLWYDKTPEIMDLENWDAATLYLDLDGNEHTKPSSNTYRFVAQLNQQKTREAYQATYRGNGESWELINSAFYTYSGWRGNYPNDNTDDRGWAVTFRIPFSNVLGLSGRPLSGTVWRMGIKMHDRDDVVGTPINDQSWPEYINGESPVSWGQLHFGLPIFTPPSIAPTGTITLRHKLNGISVKDAAVGGTITYLCPGGSDFNWDVWGEMNFTGAPNFNIQNQDDVADWPCFSKYYVTFPLDKIPPAKEIINAKLILHQFGTSAKPSLIQVLTVVNDWDESEITWNNAPLALENIGQAWVDPLVTFPGWPGVEREWDVSYGVAQAYTSGRPLRLVLYEADTAYHSGKYFSSSDAADWNEIGRPTLSVTWGDP